MQRGRGRGRGRNSHPARSNSRRGTSRSTSRTSTSQTRTRASNLRRSARLAQLLDDEELLNGDAEPSHLTNGSMADVARPRTLASRTARSRHHNSRTPGRSRGGRHSLSPEDIRYAMDVVLQPPATAWAGYQIGGSIIVRLRAMNADPNDAIADSTNLVAVATLVPGPNSQVSSDPMILSTLLAGRRFDSIHPFSDDAADGSISSMEMDDPRGVGFMLFSDLAIRQAGCYRVRITLVRIRNSSQDPPVTSASGGASVQIVDSNPIIVSGAVPGSQTNLAAYNGDEDEDDDGGWLDVLRTIQTRQRSPTGR